MKIQIPDKYGKESILLLVIGALSTPSFLLRFFSFFNIAPLPVGKTLICLILSGMLGSSVFYFVHMLLSNWLSRIDLSFASISKYRKYAIPTYIVFALNWVGYWGIFIPISVLFWLFLLGQTVMVLIATHSADGDNLFAMQGWPVFLFFLSGHAAIVYQIAWHRALFSIFGLNIESVTVVVSIFMFGLGLGSLLGGWLGHRLRGLLATVFIICELAIGIFGLVSIQLIKWVGALTMGGALFNTAIACYALLFIPTLSMGATLPILVTLIQNKIEHVGKSVGLMYGMNTIGSAFSCFITVDALFPLLGLQATVYAAVVINFVVVYGMIRYKKAVL